jgi:hypothetical protein
MKQLAVVLLAAIVATFVVVLPTASAVTKPTVVAITVKKGRPVGGIKRPAVKKGTLVRFVLTIDKGEEVHLHGYDLERRVVKGKKVVMQFTAKLAGRFELELHKPNALLAQLTVKP